MGYKKGQYLINNKTKEIRKIVKAWVSPNPKGYSKNLYKFEGLYGHYLEESLNKNYTLIDETVARILYGN